MPTWRAASDAVVALVGCILGCFDGVEDVLIGSGSVHSTAHQLIPTGVPLDPGRRTREEGSSSGLCLQPRPHCLPFILTMEIRGCGLRGSAPKMQLGISWVRTWALGAAPNPGPYFLSGSSSPCGGTPRWLLHSSSCLASSCRDYGTSLPPPPEMLCWPIWKSSLTLSLSSCLTSFKVTADFSYSWIFK